MEKKKTFAILLEQDPDYCLEARGAYPRANVCLGLYKESDLQVWTFEDGYLKPARNQNLCVNVAKINPQRPSGTNIQVFTKFSNSSPFQKWVFEKSLIKLQAKLSGHEETTFVMDVKHNRIEEGQNIHLFEENGTTAQEWNLVEVEYQGEVEDSDDEQEVEEQRSYRHFSSSRRAQESDDRMLKFAMRRGVPQKRKPRRMTKMDAVKLANEAESSNPKVIENDTVEATEETVKDAASLKNESDPNEEKPSESKPEEESNAAIEVPQIKNEEKSNEVVEVPQNETEEKSVEATEAPKITSNEITEEEKVNEVAGEDKNEEKEKCSDESENDANE